MEERETISSTKICQRGREADPQSWGQSLEGPECQTQALCSFSGIQQGTVKGFCKKGFVKAVIYKDGSSSSMSTTWPERKSQL